MKSEPPPLPPQKHGLSTIAKVLLFLAAFPVGMLVLLLIAAGVMDLLGVLPAEPTAPAHVAAVTASTPPAPPPAPPPAAPPAAPPPVPKVVETQPERPAKRRVRPQRYTKPGFYGSAELADFQLASRLRRQEDLGALEALFMLGRVFEVPEGVEVEVTDTKFFKGVVRLRARGSTLQFWTNFEAFETRETPPE